MTVAKTMSDRELAEMRAEGQAFIQRMRKISESSLIWPRY
jgi:hypothetical protein